MSRKPHSVSDYDNYHGDWILRSHSELSLVSDLETESKENEHSLLLDGLV